MKLRMECEDPEFEELEHRAYTEQNELALRLAAMYLDLLERCDSRCGKDESPS
jgi:hypothetical protein